MKSNKLEQHEKRGKSQNNAALIFCVTVAVLIAAIYFSIIVVKKRDDSLTNKQGIITSCMQIPVYLVLFLTLTGTLIKFKQLERRYNMQIKKVQVMIAFMFALLALVISIIR